MEEETKEIVVKEETQIISALPQGSEMENMMSWATMMGETPFYKKMVEGGGKYGILAIFGAARELGIPSFQALNGGLWIVNGRVTLSAQMMGLLIRKRGHMITKKIGNDEICHLVGRRADTGEECEMIFTIQQASNANLLKNPVWKNFPSVMLYNRCLSMLAKQLFQDAIGNALVEGEIENVIDVTPHVEPMNKEAMMFIDDFNLIDLNCTASLFIDSIATNTGETRVQIIQKCSKEPKKFSDNLKKFEKKIAPISSEEY